MTRIHWCHLVSAVVVGFAARQAVANAAEANSPDPAAHNLGKIHEHEGIKVAERFVSNLTEGADHPQGWNDPDLCAGHYCVFSNRELANGKGIALISTHQSLQKIKRVERHLGASDLNNLDSPPFQVAESTKQAPILIANKSLPRGSPFLKLTPTLIVHKKFFNETPVEGQAPLLEAAVRFLPDETRRALISQMEKLGKGYSIRDFVLAESIDTDLGFVSDGRYEDESHHTLYPELAVIRHDCRPNFAWYVDANHIFHSTIARAIAPGEEITISYVEPLIPRAVRNEQTQKRWGSKCTCSKCTGGGDLEEMIKSDSRIDEIKALELKLWDPDSLGVTTDTITRVLELYKTERLESRLSDVLGLAAINYNNLGYKKRAEKYANLAVQAGIIEGGQDHPHVIAMRILAQDPEGHYSWQARNKKAKRA